MENSLQIIYEDDDILVLNKPWGITVNRSDTTRDEITLQDLVEKSGKVDKQGEDPDFIARCGIVHRLDKETSGVIVIAKNSASFSNLQKQFADRLTKKTYIALAHDEILPKEGEISAPVGRLPWNRKRFGVLAGGRESVTTYKVVEVLKSDNEKLSLVRLFPKTGRTHQIRVHLKYINHPIFSDFLYGGRKTARNDRKILPRVFLHAEKLTLTHPTTGKEITFEAPLPEELSSVLENFRSNRG